MTTNAEPLTEDDFRYFRMKNLKDKTKFDPKQLVITPYECDKVFKYLSPSYHKCYIKHNIPEIPNEAPTLQQYWTELHIYRPELDSNGDVKHEFFKETNKRFASSMNARRNKFRLKPAFFYHVNDEGVVEHLDEPAARKLYCKMYEETTLYPKSDSAKMFQYLVTICKNRDRSMPIIIKGLDVDTELESPTIISDRYFNGGKKFGHEYCLVEMLIHWPNLNECIWHKYDNEIE